MENFTPNQNSWLKGTTLDLLKKMRKDHKLLFYSFYLFLLLGLLSFATKIFVTIDRYFTHYFSITQKPYKNSFYPEIEHIDIGGIFIGIAALLCGIMIAIVVEEINTNDKEVIKQKNESIENAANEIQKTTDKILQKFTSFLTVKNFPERLDILEEIISETEASSQNEFPNHLYCFNYNTSYGYLQSFNANILSESKKSDKDINYSSIEFHENVHKLYKDRHQGLFRRILNICSENIHLAILKTKNDSNGDDKYRKLLEKVFFKNNYIKVHEYYKYGQESINLEQLNPNKDLEIFVLPSDTPIIAGESETNKKKKLIDKILKYNNNNLTLLQGRSIEVSYLDYLPFQFFITAPEKMTRNSKQIALIIFTNILGEGDTPSNTIAFKTENPQLIQNLIEIYESLVRKSRKEYSRKFKFNSLFNSEDSEIQFVLKRIPDTLKERKEHDYLAYLSDIDCYSDLRELFSTQGISIDLQYDDIILNQLKSSTYEASKTYIVIGLFENQITQFINEIENENVFLGIKRFFKIYRSNFIENEGYLTEDIKIAQTAIDGSPIDEDQWSLYEKTDNVEYGLITKIRHNNQNIIIIGGLTSFGTRKIGEYIKNEWEKIIELKDKNGLQVNNNSFAILFKIPINQYFTNIDVIDIFIQK